MRHVAPTGINRRHSLTGNMATFKEFAIPNRPEDLCSEAENVAHKVLNSTDLGELSPQAIDDFAHGASLSSGAVNSKLRDNPSVCVKTRE